MDPETLKVALVVGGIILSLLLVWWLVEIDKKSRSKTQRVITDKELLLLIAEQPDGMLRRNQIADLSGLSKSQTTSRLQHLGFNGLLRANMTSDYKYVYELIHPIKEVTPPELSKEPFLTVEDLLTIFRAYDYQLNYQDFIMATGLPLDVIKRELKYFAEEKIIESLTTHDQNGKVIAQRFILNEPYRSQPEEFLNLGDVMNEQVRVILREDQLI